MPKGPKGEKRPADVIGAAIMVAKIATGDVEDADSRKTPGRAKGGHAGGVARAKGITPEKRRQIAQKASKARWEKGD